MKNISSYIFVLLFLVVSGNQYFAGSKQISSADLKFCREEGIFSDIKKVRKESLFMIFEAKDVLALPYLIKRLDTEPEPEIQVFITRVIQKLDKVEGIKALEKYAWNGDNFQVRWICRSICKTYAEENNGSYTINLARLDERLKLDDPNNM